MSSMQTYNSTSRQKVWKLNKSNSAKFMLPNFIKFVHFYRFRVLAYCADNSGGVAIVFQDEEARQIIDKSIFDIHVEYVEVNYDSNICFCLTK